MAHRLKVALVVAGLPTPDDPQRGIFNLRALQALSCISDVKAIFLRAWVPGRPRRTVSRCGATEVVTVAVPQLPARRVGAPAIAANILLYRSLGWSAVRDVITRSDIVHSVDVVVGMIVSNWANRARKHHITQAIGSDVNTIGPRIPPAVSEGLRRHLHGAACNSAELARRFSVLYPSIDNVRTIYRGVDTTVFEPGGVQLGPQARTAPVRFAYFGGFRRHMLPRPGTDIKGGFTLLSAWKEAEEELPKDASLLLAGPDAEDAVMGEWRRSLRQPERVHIVGQVAPTEMAGYLRAADAIVVPSLEEGLPNVCVESAACGRAVIGSETGGIPEVVRDGETGVILPRNDVKAWRHGLIAYARQPELLREMGRRGRAAALTLFDSRNYGPKMLDLYETALGLPLARAGK